MAYPGYPTQGGQGGYPQQGGYPGGYPAGGPGGCPPPGGFQGGYPNQCGGGYPCGPCPGGPAVAPAAPRRDFYLVSQLNGMVLDICGASKSPDAKVITWPKKGPSDKNQIWYTDPQGHIHSALNDFVLYDNGSAIVMRPASNDPKGQWYIDGPKILNRTGNSLDIKGENTKEGADIIAYKYHGGKNQHFNVQYV